MNSSPAQAALKLPVAPSATNGFRPVLLDINGEGNKNGLVAMYIFKNDGTHAMTDANGNILVKDVSGHSGGPIDLALFGDKSLANWGDDFLEIAPTAYNQPSIGYRGIPNGNNISLSDINVINRVGLVSNGAQRIAQECGNTKEYSIVSFVAPNDDVSGIEHRGLVHYGAKEVLTAIQPVAYDSAKDSSFFHMVVDGVDVVTYSITPDVGLDQRTTALRMMGSPRQLSYRTSSGGILSRAYAAGDAGRFRSYAEGGINQYVHSVKSDGRAYIYHNGTLMGRFDSSTFTNANSVLSFTGLTGPLEISIANTWVGEPTAAQILDFRKYLNFVNEARKSGKPLKNGANATTYPEAGMYDYVYSTFDVGQQDARIAGLIKGRADRHFRGAIYMIAIYCKGFTPEEAMGEYYSDSAKRPPLNPSMPDLTDLNVQTALRLIQRLTSSKINARDPLVTAVAAKLASGDRMGAVELITSDRSFYNVTVKDMARKMSNRPETILVPLNDFTASFIGVVRDEVDARELVAGNMMYLGRPTVAPSDLVLHVLASNDHYQFLDQKNFDLSKALVRVDKDHPWTDARGRVIRGQMLRASATSAVPSPDPAGVLTSKSFLENHAIAGTNRRLVEFTFREFMCTPIQGWADVAASEAMITRDIDRFPGGDPQAFANTCKACHTVMDGFRGAFARYNYASDMIKHTFVHKNGADTNTFQTPQDANGVVAKINLNNVYSAGNVVTDDYWENNANVNNNAAFFGWRGSNIKRGYGVGSLGAMIGNSERLSLCMSKRVAESVCKKPISTADLSGWVKELSKQFESDNYNLKKLFQRTALNENCLGIK
jgi:hypothetical protein